MALGRPTGEEIPLLASDERTLAASSSFKMTRRLRFAPEGHLIEVTCRTIQSRMIMRPSDEMEDLTVGLLGRTQEQTGMTICGYSFQSNHFHLLLLPRNSHQLARFMCSLNSNLAREAGRLHGWRDRVWARRYSAIVVASDEASHVGRLKYLLGQGCKEGLVSSPREWPGATCVHALLSGTPPTGTWFDRTREYRARLKGVVYGRRDFTTTHTVVLMTTSSKPKVA